MGDFDWNKALENLGNTWASIESAKANLAIKKLDARTTGTSTGLQTDGQRMGFSESMQAALPWALLIGGGLLVYVLVRK